MIRLDATTKTLEVDLTSAVTTTQLPFTAHYSDINTSTALLTAAGESDGATNNTTAVTLVSAPAASTTRKIDYVSIYNADTVAAEVTVQLNNNSTLRVITKQTVQPGETLEYVDGVGWGLAGKKNEIISTLNSTTATLAGSGTFTGTGEQNDKPDLFVMCISDVSGTLFFDFSNDGTNWDSTYPTAGFVCSAGVPEVHEAVKAGRYFRVRYVNDSVAQSYFRLTTYYGTYSDLTAPLNQSIARDADASVVRPTNSQDEISIGLRSGVYQFNKFGYKTNSTAAGGQEVVWPLSTAALTILTTASTYTITYDGTAGGSTDGASTTGATVLLFDHIDENGEREQITHTLGTDGSDETAFTGLGINRCVVTSSGTNDVNVSDITITATTGGSNQAFIPAGEGVTQQLIFHVPTNARALAKLLYVRCNKLSGSSPVVTFYGWVYNRTVDSKFLVYRETLRTADDRLINLIDPCNFPLSAGDVFYLTMDTDTNNTVAETRASFNIYNNA